MSGVDHYVKTDTCGQQPKTTSRQILRWKCGWLFKSFHTVHITSDECPAHTFEVFRNTNVNGAREDRAADTVDECRTSCRCESDCAGFDFDTNSNQCWRHIAPENGDVETYFDNRPQNSAPGVDLYVRRPSGTPCPGYGPRHTGLCQSFDPKHTLENVAQIQASCIFIHFADGCSTDTFSVFRDTNANGAREDRTASTVNECKKNCRCDEDCVGFDFDTSSDRCWIHSDPDNIEPDKRNDAPGVDLYVRRPSGQCISSKQKVYFCKQMTLNCFA